MTNRQDKPLWWYITASAGFLGMIFGAMAIAESLCVLAGCGA